MALQVETAKIDPDVAVVRVSGNMTFEATGALRPVIRALLDQGMKKLILDLSGVEEIDRVGGVALIRCFFEAREAEAGFCVAGSSPRVMALFKSTQVDTLIPFFPTTAAARKYLTDPPRAGVGSA